MKAIDAMIRLRDMFTPVLRQVDSAMREHERAASTMRQSTAAMGASLQAASRAAQEHSKEIIRMGKSISSAGDSITAMSNKAAMLAAPLMAAAGAGLKMNSDLTNGMAKVSTLVDTTVVDMAALRRGIIGVSSDTGVALDSLTEAQYQAISANISAAKSVDFVRQAVISSKAGFTDTTTAVDGLTTVLNAYGLSAESASRISDQMLMTQNLGKTTFGEMAAVIGQVASSASLAKVGTDELFTSIAVLTKNGIKTPEAITEINGVLSMISTAAARPLPSFLGTKRWEIMPRKFRDKSMSSCWWRSSGKKLMMRSIAWLALLACKVAKHKWPVSANAMACSMVSASRISPISITSGAWRKVFFKATSQLSVSMPTSRCMTTQFLCG